MIRKRQREELKDMKFFTYFIVTMLAIFLGFTILLCIYLSKTTETRYSLSEIEDGVYVTYNKVISAIPAQNYEIVAFCSGGIVRTFTGSVEIIYTDERPYAFVKDHPNRRNGAEVLLYIPKGTVKFLENVGLR